jgi:hypothetical protein
MIAGPVRRHEIEARGLKVVDAAAMALLQGLDPVQERGTARLGYSVREIGPSV